jgi:hypothetical protein
MADFRLAHDSLESKNQTLERSQKNYRVRKELLALQWSTMAL